MPLVRWIAVPLVLLATPAIAQSVNFDDFHAPRRVQEISFANCKINAQESCVFTFQGRAWTARFEGKVLTTRSLQQPVRRLTFDGLLCSSENVRPVICNVSINYSASETSMFINAPLGLQVNQVWKIDPPVGVKFE
jgi:hypothetical protein